MTLQEKCFLLIRSIQKSWHWKRHFENSLWLTKQKNKPPDEEDSVQSTTTISALGTLCSRLRHVVSARIEPWPCSRKPAGQSCSMALRHYLLRITCQSRDGVAHRRVLPAAPHFSFGLSSGASTPLCEPLSPWPFVSKTGRRLDVLILRIAALPCRVAVMFLICLGITQREQLSAVSPRKTAEWRGGRATVENKNMIYTEFLFNHVNVSSTVCCPGFQIPAYSYHLVNRKVCANKNKSFLCCSGPPLHNSGLCSCSVPWKTNSAVQLGSSRQQKGNFNPLPPFFFPLALLRFIWS